MSSIEYTGNQVYKNQHGNQYFYDVTNGPRRTRNMWDNMQFMSDICDPAFATNLKDPFFDYISSSWTQTTVGTGTVACNGTLGGVLELTNSAADDDSLNLQRVCTPFRVINDKPIWFEAGLKVSDSTQSEWVVGLCATQTDLLDGVEDGVYFKSADGSNAITAATSAGSTETTLATGQTAAANEDLILGFRFFSGGIQYYINGNLIGDIELSDTVVLTTEPLTVSFAIRNGEAVAKKMTLNYYQTVFVHGMYR